MFWHHVGGLRWVLLGSKSVLAATARSSTDYDPTPYIYAKDEEPVAVPSLRGQPVEQVKAALEALVALELSK